MRTIKYQLIDITNGIKYEPLTIEEISYGQWEVDGRYYKDGEYDKKGDEANLPRKDYCYMQEEGTEFVWRQYTGLLDKNGKDIYENDLIKIVGGITNPYEVKFEKGSFKLGRDELGIYAGVGEIEIIGNIYENINLLTSK